MTSSGTPKYKPVYKKKSIKSLKTSKRFFFFINLVNKNISLKSTKESSGEMGSGGVKKSNLQYVQSQFTKADEEKETCKGFSSFSPHLLMGVQ